MQLPTCCSTSLSSLTCVYFHFFVSSTSSTDEVQRTLIFRPVILGPQQRCMKSVARTAHTHVINKMKSNGHQVFPTQIWPYVSLSWTLPTRNRTSLVLEVLRYLLSVLSYRNPNLFTRDVMKGIRIISSFATRRFCTLWLCFAHVECADTFANIRKL